MVKRKLMNYIRMEQEEITRTLNIIDELNMKFPLLPITSLNFDYLSEHFKVNKRQVYSMIAFIRWIASYGTYIDINDVKSLKVKRGGDNWEFSVVGVNYKKPVISSFKFELNEED